MPHLSYTEQPYPPARQLISDFLAVAHATHQASGTFEVNVSLLFERLEEYREQIPLSLTAYVVYTYARAVGQHRYVNSYRKGRNKLIVFDEVDVGTLYERARPDGTVAPITYIVRRANEKTLAQINHEIQQASKSDLYTPTTRRSQRQVTRLPQFVRRFMLKRMLRDPFKVKQQWGTVGVSNVGAMGDGRPFTATSLSFLTNSLMIGGVYERVCWIDGKAQPRKMMGVTMMLNHDILDGGHVTRLGKQWVDMVECAFGLDATFLAQAQMLTNRTS